MKISKKDLRRIIFESIVQEQATSKVVAAAPKKTKKGEGRAENPAKDIAGLVKALIDDAVTGDNSFNAIITIGRGRTRVKKATGSVGDLAKVLKRRIKDSEDIQRARRDLKRLSAVKVIYDKKADEEPEVQAEEVKEEAEVVATPEEQQQQGTAKPKRRSSGKTAYIQQVIKAPSSKGGTQQGDGQWGKNTSAAWRDWVKEPDTMKKFAALEKTLNESQDLYNLFSKIISEQAGESQAEPDKSEAPESPAQAEETTPAVSEELKKLIDAGDAGELAKHFGLTGNLSGVHELVRKLQDQSAPDEGESPTDPDEPGADVSGEEPKESVELITPASKAGFKGIKDLLTGSVNKEEMSQIHSLIFAMSKSGQFKKVKAESGKGSKDPLYLAIKDAFGDEGHEIAYQVLKNFSLGPTPHSRIRFPLAGEVNLYKVDGKPAETGALGNVSYSVLVDDVEKMLTGGDPEYAPGGKNPSVNESNAERLSHGALIRKRYRRY